MELARCVLLFKVLKDLIAVSDDLKPAPSAHGRALRSGTAGNLPHMHAKNEHFNNSFFPRTIRDWNSLPAAAKTAEELEEFKTKISQKP